MVYDIYYKTNIMKERLDETNKMRRLMDLPLITEQSNNRTENYTVKKGDSLDLIAKSFNKNKKCKITWQAIYDINKKAIEDAQNKNGGVKTCSDSWCKGRETPNPNLIFAGTVLKVPTSTCGDEAPKTDSECCDCVRKVIEKKGTMLDVERCLGIERDLSIKLRNYQAEPESTANRKFGNNTADPAPEIGM